jgi:hypothetical protein
MMRPRLTLRAGSASLLIGLAGCVQVTAPEKPIEINLNVNVKQEVLVRLQRDAQEIIEDNPELFPR